MNSTIVVTGTLLDERTVRLDEPAPHADKAVQVVLHPGANGSAQETGGTAEGNRHAQALAEIREEQKEYGHVPRSLEEVDQELRQLRDGWGD